jgi:LPXTG-motif cell wall-anchored protein
MGNGCVTPPTGCSEGDMPHQGGCLPTEECAAGAMTTGDCSTPNRPPAILGTQGFAGPPSSSPTVLGTQAIAGVLPNTGAGALVGLAGLAGVVLAVAGGLLLASRRKSVY